MAAAATTEEAKATEQLKYQTWNLKVSIHCEGCRRKVKKVLQSIEGVYMTTIDSQKHKVTVTGNIGRDALIKKLIKHGKPAELWPEPEPKPKPNPNPKPSPNNGSNKNKNKNKNQPKPNSESSETQEPKEQEQEPEPEPEQKNSSDESKEPPAEGKKKKTKGKKGNSDDNGSEAKEVQGNPKPPPPPPPPPHQQEYCNLPMYPLPLAPHNQYVVSYSAMQPGMAGSYCIPATAMAAVGSYDLFTEENANACSVM